MSILQFLEGPMFYVAFAIFALGAVWRVAGIVRLGRKADLAPPKGSAVAGWFKGNLRHFVPRGIFAERAWMHLVAGYGFHLGLFVLFFFGAPHVAFIERFTGLSWTTLPRWGFIIAAEFAFAGLIVLWVRRISDPVMRQISDRDDHAGSWLTFLVMLSGIMAMEQAHDSLRAIHMGLVNIWLIYFPFSRLMHAFTFALARGATGASYGRKGMIP